MAMFDMLELRWNFSLKPALNWKNVARPKRQILTRNFCLFATEIVLLSEIRLSFISNFAGLKDSMIQGHNLKDTYQCSCKY